MSDESHKLGIVLPAGGARAAYQVGVVRFLGEAFPEAAPKVMVGISAGSINASFLAQGDPFPVASAKLYSLWRSLVFSQVLQTNFRSIFTLGARWIYDLFVSKVTRKLLLKSLLDASPLAHTLLANVHFWKVANAIRQGTIEGLAVTATNYHDGCTTIFYDSHHPIEPWRREQRRAIRTRLRTRHIMASCSIPILFQPIRIGDHWFGDGSLRFSFPLSPAIKLGATRILAVGIRSSSPENALASSQESVGLGFVAGSVLNSIFLDSLEADFENLERLNRAGHNAAFKSIDACLVRPSRDLGAIAREFIGEVPFHLRQVLRSTASTDELGDLLSYLMFSPGYLKALLELGYEDARKCEAQLKKLVTPS